MRAVEVAQQVQRAPPRLGIYAVGVREEKHWIALGTELHALIERGKEAAAPAGFSTVGLVQAGKEHHKSRQVGAFAADAISQPRAHAGTSQDLVAGVHENLAGGVVELRGLQRFDNGDVMHDGREMRQQVRKLCTALAVPRKGVRRAQELRRSLNKREALALDDVLRNRLAVVSIERGLVIEPFHLRVPPPHKQKNDPPNLSP